MDISSKKTGKIAYRKTWLRKVNIKRNKSSFQNSKNNAIRTNYIKAKIDNRRQNSKCRLCGDKDETVMYIKDCNKLAQKEYNIRHD